MTAITDVKSVTKFKTAIDWMNLSTPILAKKHSEYIPYIRIFKETFPNVTFTERKTEMKTILESEDMYIMFAPLCFYWEIRGLWFTRHLEKRIAIIRELAIIISQKYNELEKDKKDFESLLTISQIDICNDYINTSPSQLVSSFFSPENKACFQCEKTRYIDKKNVETSVNLYTSRWKLRVYDKIRENKKQKNIEKKKFYENLYPKDTSVCRAELSIRGTPECKDFTYLLYDKNTTDEYFCAYVLNYWWKNHRVRKIDLNDSNESRWADDENWTALFNNTEIKIVPLKTIKAADLMSGKILEMNISKHANAIVNDLEKHGYELSCEYVVDALAIAVVDFNARKKERERKLLESKEYFQYLLMKAGGTIAAHDEPKHSEGEECIEADGELKAQPLTPKKAA